MEIYHQPTMEHVLQLKKIQKGIFGLGIEIQELGDMTARL
jgi:hypothetical protein